MGGGASCMGGCPMPLAVPRWPHPRTLNTAPPASEQQTLQRDTDSTEHSTSAGAHPGPPLPQVSLSPTCVCTDEGATCLWLVAGLGFSFALSKRGAGGGGEAHESLADQNPSLPHRLCKLKQRSCRPWLLPMSLTQSWTKRAVGREAGGDSRQCSAGDISPSCENCAVDVRTRREVGPGGARGE